MKGECQSDDDCPLEKACIDYYCVNPCLTNSTCSAQDFCQVRNHVPVCGFNHRITQEVRDRLRHGVMHVPRSHEKCQFQPRTPIVVGGRYNVEDPPEPRGFPVVIGATSGHKRRPDGALDLRDLAVASEGRRR